MSLNKLKNVHPGEILWKEFLKPMGLEPADVSRKIFADPARIRTIVNQEHTISPDTALRLGKFFGNSPEFWLGLRNAYELENREHEIRRDLKKIKPFKAEGSVN